MKTKLRTLWKSRSPRDRKIIIALLVIVFTLVYAELLYSTEQSRASLRSNVMTLRAQAAHLDAQAIEYHQLLATAPMTISPTDLAVLLQERVNDAGLSSALQRMDTLDPNQVVATFAAIAFVDWLHWIIELKTQHIRVASCRIEALSTPGLVNVTVTLVRK